MGSRSTHLFPKFWTCLTSGQGVCVCGGGGVGKMSNSKNR